MIVSSIFYVIFFILGYIAGRSVTTPVSIKELKQTTLRALRPKPKAGVLPFKQADEFTKEAIQDKELEKHWQQSGLAKEVMENT